LKKTSQTCDKRQKGKTMKRIVLAFAFVGILFTATGFIGPFKETEKVVIILQADMDRHEGLARAFHALLYAQELKEVGCKVELIFDGAGTRWAEELTHPESKSPLLPTFLELQKMGVKMVVCSFCANAFDVKKALQQRKANLVDTYHGHPSLAPYVKKNYRILIL